MSKYIFTVLFFLTAAAARSQDNSNFTYRPFSIYKAGGKVIIAGSLPALVYSNYSGKDVKNEKYTSVHSKPEYPVYELFNAMKNKNVNAIGKLYDTSFKKKNFDGNRMATMMQDYTDIKFVSKFRSGDFTVIRYDFTAPGKQYAYFAALQEKDRRYYLTSDINMSEPFNVIGSFSPVNLFDRPEESVNITDMVPFYFIRRAGKVFYSAELPAEDYTAVYLAIEKSKKSKSPEMTFVKKIQKAAQSSDSAEMKKLLISADLPLLADPYFNGYLYAEIKKIFQHFPDVTPLATVQINDGRIFYFSYSAPGQTSNIGSVIIKQQGGKDALSLRISDDNITNVLQNVYVEEALYGYLKKMQ